MKKFKFKLQKLLDIRQSKEDIVKNELAREMGEQNKIRVKQQNYRNNINSVRKKFHDKMVIGESNAADLHSYHRFAAFAEKAIKDSQLAIDKMEPALNAIRERLMAATKERCIIEKLKDHRYKEWEYEVKRAIDKENDDMNQKIFLRTKGEYYAR